MIYIDTDTLKQLSHAAKSATEELINAENLLRQVTAHWDWGCEEKVQINNYIETNRNSIIKLRSDAASFTKVIEEITEEFVESESGIANLFGSVDNVLSRIISIPAEVVNMGTGIITGGSDKGILSTIDFQAFAQDLKKGVK